MAKPGAKRKLGRPSTFTQAVGDKLCARIADGESVRQICLDPTSPDRRTIYKWLELHEDFRHQYEIALTAQADEEFDMLRELARQAQSDPRLTQALRLIIDTDKWVMSKKLPKKYGDRQTVEHQGGVVFTAPNQLDD